ncbi:MAG: carbohydrate-binding domain-containing protein [Bacteroidaceae bacterium]
MKRIIILLFAFFIVYGAKSQDVQDMMYIYMSGGNVPAYLISDIKDITFSEDQTLMQVDLASQVQTYSISEIDSITFGTAITNMQVIYGLTSAQVFNPYVADSVSVDVNGAYVTINSSTEQKGFVYTLKGTTTQGNLKVYSDKKYVVQLAGVSLRNPIGPALNLQSKKGCDLVLIEGTLNSLFDASGYSTANALDEDEKGCLFAEGQIVFGGSGSLTVAGYNNHAVCTDDYLEFPSNFTGSLKVSTALNDGLHAKDYTDIENGTITVVSSKGDAISGGEYVLLNGGTIDLTVAADSLKKEGLKADSTITINGGQLTITNRSQAGKCMKAGAEIFLNAGTLKLTNTGSYYLLSGDLDSPIGVKCDRNITISGGVITLVNSGSCGKGISADGYLTMTGGAIDGTFSGAGLLYTNGENESDASSSKCLNSDGAMCLYGGSVTSVSTGSAGKGITSAGMLIIGESVDSDGPIINVTTSGAELTNTNTSNISDVSISARAGGGAPPWGGGDVNDTNGSSPKAIKSVGDLTINSGSILVKTSQTGGEGIESKATITINGGNIEGTCADDVINAATYITVNGGTIYAYSTGNDGIDSNGKFLFTGGVIISSGTTAPEEGFDCDANTFAITGGILIGMGGGSSTPTTSSSTQRYWLKSNISLTSGSVYRLTTSTATSGTNVLVFKAPRTLTSATVLLSSPLLIKGTTYYLMKGATVTGAETFHGYYETCTATGGTTSGSTQAM